MIGPDRKKHGAAFTLSDQSFLEMATVFWNIDIV